MAGNDSREQAVSDNLIEPEAMPRAAPGAKDRAALTLLSALADNGLRLAQWPETKAFRFVLECKVCGEVHEAHPMMDLPGYCFRCGLSWKQANSTLWVLISQSVPLPEEEG